MNLLDVNVLVALFRPDHVHHDRATRWWSASEQAVEAFSVPDAVAVGFCRLTTNPGAYSTPATLAEALDFLDAREFRDLCLRFVCDPRVMAEFGRPGLQTVSTGNLLYDAYIAATALTLGATVVTFDRDYRRFDGLKLLEPA